MKSNRRQMKAGWCGGRESNDACGLKPTCGNTDNQRNLINALPEQLYIQFCHILYNHRNHVNYVKRVVKGKSERSRFWTYIAKYKLEWYHSGNDKGFHSGVKFLASASSSEFFIPVYCAEDTMVRPHTFIITASQGERTLFGTTFLCTALSYQVSEREQILINS